MSVQTWEFNNVSDEVMKMKLDFETRTYNLNQLDFQVGGTHHRNQYEMIKQQVPC